jgi:hypothetical protein
MSSVCECTGVCLDDLLWCPAARATTVSSNLGRAQYYPISVFERREIRLGERGHVRRGKSDRRQDVSLNSPG